MFSISNMFVHTKGADLLTYLHQPAFLWYSHCSTNIKDIIRQERRYSQKSGLFPRAVKQVPPDFTRKQWTSTKERTSLLHFPKYISASTCGLKITRIKFSIFVISPVSVLMGSCRKKAPHTPKDKKRTLKPSVVDSVDLLPV